MGQSEIFFLKLSGGVKAVAMYVIAFNLAQKIVTIPNAYSGILIPAFARRASRGESSSVFKLYSASINAYCLLIVPCALLVASQSTMFIRVLFGARYLPASAACAVTMLTVPATCFTVPAMSVIYATTGVRRRTLCYMLVPAALDIALSYAIIPIWGINGAAIANFCTQWSMAICMTIYVTRSHNLVVLSSYLSNILTSAVLGALSSAAIVLFGGQQFAPLGFVVGGLLSLFELRRRNIFAGAEFQRVHELAAKVPARPGTVVRGILRWLSKSEGMELVPVPVAQTLPIEEPAVTESIKTPAAV
jgi:O-antigen/teichoic acid export membrane protein